MYSDTYWYGQFFLFWHVETVPKMCQHLSDTPCIYRISVVPNLPKRIYLSMWLIRLLAPVSKGYDSYAKAYFLIKTLNYILQKRWRNGLNQVADDDNLLDDTSPRTCARFGRLRSASKYSWALYVQCYVNCLQQNGLNVKNMDIWRFHGHHSHIGPFRAMTPCCLVVDYRYFWGKIASIFYLQFLWNVGNHLPDCMASHYRIPKS
jgi:hypothetical protein